MVDRKTAPYAFRVIRGRSLVVVALSGAALGTAASPPHVYTRQATQSCLFGLPNAVAGLPPATPPRPSGLFVHALRHDAISTWDVGNKPRPRHSELGAWYATTGYPGLILSFFASPAAAAAWRTSFHGSMRTGNVVVTWESKPNDRVQAMVLGCLRSSGAGRAAPRAPAASLATFAGGWGGHGRGLTITPSGAGSEGTNDGCCTRVYALRFRILSVRGTVTNATATYRVTAFRRYNKEVARSHVGEVGRLVLRNGIVTNSLTRVYFCSEPAWGATGACGA